jgi:hypothetical protein
MGRLPDKTRGAGSGLAIAGLGKQDAPAQHSTRQDDHTGTGSPATAKPKARDRDLWHLAERFYWHAQQDGIELAQSVPIVAHAIGELVTRFKLRERSTFRQVTTGCSRQKLSPALADHCWYHYPPSAPNRQDDRLVTWWELVEVIIAEFWSRIQDENALDNFRQHFAEYGRACLKHWAYLAMAEQARKNPAPRQDRMARATMTDAAKEG